MGPTETQAGPMLAPCILLSRNLWSCQDDRCRSLWYHKYDKHRLSWCLWTSQNNSNTILKTLSTNQNCTIGYIRHPLLVYADTLINPHYHTRFHPSCGNEQIRTHTHTLTASLLLSKPVQYWYLLYCWLLLLFCFDTKESLALLHRQFENNLIHNRLTKQSFNANVIIEFPDKVTWILRITPKLNMISLICSSRLTRCMTRIYVRWYSCGNWICMKRMEIHKVCQYADVIISDVANVMTS